MPRHRPRSIASSVSGGAALAAALGLLCGAQAAAQAVQVAVTANFAEPMKQIAARFEQATGLKVGQSVGATGRLYALIRNGAPFDLFLSADQATPARLEQEGATLAGSRFTYATGKLVLWSAKPDLVDARGDVLKSGRFDKLASASPALAPYGVAAMEAMTQLGLADRLEPKLVRGESIGQAYSFIASGNAQLGFVALSQVYQNGKIKNGSAWVVPAALYTPIRQDAVQLLRARGNKAATELATYLQSREAQTILRAFGYE